MKPVARTRVNLFQRFTVVRFGFVALLGEAFYFLLYGLVLTLTNSTSATLAIAGGICLLLNAYIHSRVTFRVRFSRKLLIGYLLIQLIGFILSFIVGLALEKSGTDKWVIAFVTYAIWAAISFLLTKIVYGSGESISGLYYPSPIRKR
jgi:putative flippase GtrA